MKNSEYIKDLLIKKEKTSSICEEMELKLTIDKWCYDLLKTIWMCEAFMEDFDESLSILADNYGQQQQILTYHSSKYSCYKDEDYRGNVGIRIYHEYCFKGDPQTDIFFIPFYVMDDIENGLKKYHKEKLKESQDILRRTIVFDLKCVKKKIEQLKDIPEDFKKIIDDNFWDLI